MPGLRETSRIDANAGQRPSAGGDDGPALQRKRLKQFHRAGQRDDSIDVSDFPALNLAVFDGVIGVRQKLTYCRNTWPSMLLPYDSVRVEPVLTRPARPHTRNRRRRIH